MGKNLCGIMITDTRSSNAASPKSLAAQGFSGRIFFVNRRHRQKTLAALRFSLARKAAYPLPPFSSSHRNRFAGLRRENGGS